MTINRVLRLYRVFARNNLVRELEFRGNFWAKIVTNLAWLSMSLAFIEIFFHNTNAVAGWNKGEATVLLGTYLVSQAVSAFLFSMNLTKIPEMVRLGTLDFVMTKPVSSQFFVSARYLSLDELGSLVGAFAVLWYGARLAHLYPSAGQIAAWLLLVACGIAVFYAFQLILMTLSFWLVRIDNLWALADTVINTARQPISIFGPKIGFALTYIIPLAFIAYVPALAFKEGVSIAWIAAALIVTTLFLAAASWFWSYASRVYTSASS